MAEQIYGLIGKAMQEIGAIGKNSRNQQQGFMYRGIDAVYNALSPVMAKNGLFIIPEILDHRREERQTNKGGNLIYSIITIKYTMYAPDGSSVSGTVVGEGMDSGDKATNKAMSVAMKYFCFQTFMIPTEELTDPDSEVHVVTAERKVPTAPAQVTPVARTSNEKPALAEVSAKVPQENPVLKYIANEQAFMAQKLGIDAKQMKAQFAQWRKSLIDGGTIENISADKLTMEQAKQLVEAVYINFMGDAQ